MIRFSMKASMLFVFSRGFTRAVLKASGKALVDREQSTIVKSQSKTIVRREVGTGSRPHVDKLNSFITVVSS